MISPELRDGVHIAAQESGGCETSGELDDFVTSLRAELDNIERGEGFFHPQTPDLTPDFEVKYTGYNDREGRPVPRITHGTLGTFHLRNGDKLATVKWLVQPARAEISRTSIPERADFRGFVLDFAWPHSGASMQACGRQSAMLPLEEYPTLDEVIGRCYEIEEIVTAWGGVEWPESLT